MILGLIAPETDANRGILGLEIKGKVTFMAFDHSLREAKPHSSTLADFFGGEKGLKDLLSKILWDTRSIITHTDQKGLLRKV